MSVSACVLLTVSARVQLRQATKEVAQAVIAGYVKLMAAIKTRARAAKEDVSSFVAALSTYVGLRMMRSLNTWGGDEIFIL